MALQVASTIIVHRRPARLHALRPFFCMRRVQMKQVRHAILLSLLALVVALLGSGGMAHAQEPRSGLEATALTVSSACPPDVIFGCVLSGSAPHGWRVDNSSAANQAVALWGQVTAANPGSPAAGVRGQVTSTTAATGFGVWGRHNGSGTGVYGQGNAGTGVHGQSTDGRGVFGRSTNGIGVSGLHSASTGAAPGVLGQTNATSDEAVGVLGVVNTTSAGADSAGIRGVNSDTSSAGFGIWGSHAGSGTGIYGYAPWGMGVVGFSPHHTGVRGESEDGWGMYGLSGTGTGVIGLSTSFRGVQGQSTSGTGVYGFSPGGFGIEGRSTSSSGVYGQSTSTIGVEGRSTSGTGVWAQSTSGTGLEGRSTTGTGVRGQSTSGYAGYFQGNVHVTGTLTGAGASSTIDHPLDPAHHYLSHAAVHSPDMMNVYNGNVTTDARGVATVILPAYVEALNHDFRYQLTVIGQFAQAIVATKIQNNQFTIRTSRPHVEVSWQVTGTRQDPWANAHRVQVEVPKPQAEQGTYLFPQGYGQPESLGRDYQEETRHGRPEAPMPEETRVAPPLELPTETSLPEGLLELSE
jgi:hypothetical protein